MVIGYLLKKLQYSGCYKYNTLTFSNLLCPHQALFKGWVLLPYMDVVMDRAILSKL